MKSQNIGSVLPRTGILSSPARSLHAAGTRPISHIVTVLIDGHSVAVLVVKWPLFYLMAPKRKSSDAGDSKMPARSRKVRPFKWKVCMRRKNSLCSTIHSFGRPLGVLDRVPHGWGGRLYWCWWAGGETHLPSLSLSQLTWKVKIPRREGTKTLWGWQRMCLGTPIRVKITVIFELQSPQREREDTGLGFSSVANTSQVLNKYLLDEWILETIDLYAQGSFLLPAMKIFFKYIWAYMSLMLHFKHFLIDLLRFKNIIVLIL